MELKGRWKKAKDLVAKYRYVLLVLAVGVFLMLLPTGSKSQKSTTQEETPIKVQQDISQELEQILSQIQGAGRVEVMLTRKSGEQTYYQQNSDLNTGENGNQRQETVVITGQDRVQSGLVQRIDPPVYLGAIIVCQGADSATVRLDIIDAVSRITGLGSDRISVLKMK